MADKWLDFRKVSELDLGQVFHFFKDFYLYHYNYISLFPIHVILSLSTYLSIFTVLFFTMAMLRSVNPFHLSLHSHIATPYSYPPSTYLSTSAISILCTTSASPPPSRKSRCQVSRLNEGGSGKLNLNPSCLKGFHDFVWIPTELGKGYPRPKQTAWRLLTSLSLGVRSGQTKIEWAEQQYHQVKMRVAPGRERGGNGGAQGGNRRGWIKHVKI